MGVSNRLTIREMCQVIADGLIVREGTNEFPDEVYDEYPRGLWEMCEIYREVCEQMETACKITQCDDGHYIVNGRLDSSNNG